VADACTVDTNGDGSVTNDDCVLTPESSNGYSSYFAIDITNENSPVLLWEFSNSGLGFSTSGPAIVRVGERDKNGKWVVVLGSGPTGPIEKTTHQFMGNSDQNLKLFLLDLQTGTLLGTIDTGIANAFAGSLEDATFDSDVDYQDDILYVGYTKKSLATGKWTDGGVLRLMTHESTDVGTWDASVVMDGIGPVTSSVTRLQNNKAHELWLFFGTGRYYFEIDDQVDDGDATRRLYGVKDPCFTNANIIDPASCAAISGTITDVTAAADANKLPEDIGTGGWYIDLDDSDPYTYNERGTLVARNYRAERVISNPLAASTGIVFFSTFKPYNETCSYGGKSFTWAMRYNTGGAGGTLLRGIALVQVSTGSIEQMSLSEAFKQDALKNPDSKGDRRGPAIEGKVGGSIRLMSTPPPIKRVLHIRER
jgi:type IV pilus assembly protein PilY1